MANRSIDYYLPLPYRVEIFPEEDGHGYTATIPDLPGCMTSADTLDGLWQMLEEAKRAWIEVAIQEGQDVPEPTLPVVESHSGRFVVRLPRSLHRRLAERAKTEDTSLNQLVVSLLSEGMGKWATERAPYLPSPISPIGLPLQALAWAQVFERKMGQFKSALAKSWTITVLPQPKHLWKKPVFHPPSFEGEKGQHVRH